MRVHRAGFAAIKGTRHLTRSSLRLATVGIEGDREFAVVDPATHHVLRTVRHPALARVEARVHGNRLTLRLPDGAGAEGPTDRVGPPVPGDYWGRRVLLHPLDGSLDAFLSELLGRGAALFAAEPGQIVWGAPVSVITTGALDRLELALRSAGVAVPDDLAARFRSNLVLEAESDPAPGQVLRVGSAVVQVVGPIDRCAVVDADPRSGLRAGGLLTALAGPQGLPVFGVDARVLEAGSAAHGDLVIHC